MTDDDIGRLEQAVTSTATSSVSPTIDDGFTLAIPLLSMPGREDPLQLTLHYTSNIWMQLPGALTLDPFRSWSYLAPGWSLGFGRLVPVRESRKLLLFSSDTTPHRSAVDDIVEPGGPSSPDWTCRATTTDGSFIQFGVDVSLNGNLHTGFAIHPDGTRYEYGAYRAPESPSGPDYVGYFPTPSGLYPTRIIDRNGNFVAIHYRNDRGPEIERIVDTLGREVSFIYSDGGRGPALDTIIAPTFNSTPSVAVKFHSAIVESWSGLGDAKTIPRFSPFNLYRLLTAIEFPRDDTGYWFGDPDSYTAQHVLRRVQRVYAFSTDRTVLEQHELDLEDMSVTHASPRVLAYRHSYSFDDNPVSATTTYARETENELRILSMRRPDGSIQKTARFTGEPQWRAGLTSYISEIVDGAEVHRSTYQWEKGSWQSAFLAELRETRTVASERQERITRFVPDSFNQVASERVEVQHYQPGSDTLPPTFFVLRRTDHTYERRSEYLVRGLLALRTSTTVIDASGNVLQETTMEYDGQPLDDPNLTFEQHLPSYRPDDPQYDPKTKTRGNLTTVREFALVDGQPDIITDTSFDIFGRPTKRAVTGEPTTTCNYDDPAAPGPTGRLIGDATEAEATKAGYDGATGLPSTRTDTFDNTSELRYSPSGRLIAVVSDRGLTTTLQHEYIGTARKWTVSKLADGHLAAETVIEEDAMGRVRRTSRLVVASSGQEPERFIQDWQYDHLGRLEYYSDEHEESKPRAVNRIAYDSFGRRTAIRRPPNAARPAWIYRYDDPDWPLAGPTRTVAWNSTVLVSNELGEQIWVLRGVQDDLECRLQPNGAREGATVFDNDAMVTRYRYDSLRRLQQIDLSAAGMPPSVRARFAYDGIGRVVAEYRVGCARTLGLHGEWQSGDSAERWSYIRTWQSRQRIATEIDPRGVRTTNRYLDGGLRSLLSITRDQDVRAVAPATEIDDVPQVEYQYDPKHPSLLKNVLLGGTIVESFLDYDTQGRPASGVFSSPSHSVSLQRGWSYDLESRVIESRRSLTGVVTAPERVQKIGYDSLGRIASSLIEGIGGVADVRYMPDGRFRLTEHVDADGGALFSENLDVDDAAFTYFAADGDVMLIGRMRPPAVTDNVHRVWRVHGRAAGVPIGQDYRYGPTGNLLEVRGEDWRVTYSQNPYCDLTGSIMTGPAGPETGRDVFPMDVDPVTSRVSSFGIEYDEAGNVTRLARPGSGTVMRFRFDAAGRLVTVLDDMGTPLESVSYTHDWRRTSRTDESTGKTHVYLWDGQQEAFEIEFDNGPTSDPSRIRSRTGPSDVYTLVEEREPGDQDRKSI